MLLNGLSLSVLIVLNHGESPFPALFHTPGGRLTLLPALAGVVLVTVTAMVGGLIAARRPGNPVGWLLCIGALLAAAFYGTFQYAAAAWLTRPGTLPAATATAWLAQWLWVAAFGLLISVFLFFPDGRYPSPRWRPVAWLVGGGLAALLVVFALAPGRLGDFPVDNPVGIAGMAGPASRAALVSGMVWPGLVVTAVASVIVRFRRADGVERQQIKYLAVAAVLLPVAIVVYQLGSLPWPAPMIALILSMTAVPVAVGLAMLRYRLYEVARVISRTVTYALLTGLLVSIYLVAVFGLQQIVQPMTGESQLAMAGATLAVAALFQPAGAGFRQPWIASSTGFVTTPSARWRRSALGCATTLTSTNSAWTWATPSERPWSPPRCPCGCATRVTRHADDHRNLPSHDHCRSPLRVPGEVEVPLRNVVLLRG